MKHSMKVGISFGTTSGIITTLGLITGLYAGTGSRLAVIGGIIIIAIADALSDALGIHISEESEAKHTQKQVWESTLATFGTKFVVALSFAIPFIFLELSLAVLIAIVWAILLIGLLSFYIAKGEHEKLWKVVGEHLLIALVVLLVTYYVGGWVAATF